MTPSDLISADRAMADAYVRHVDGDLLLSAIARSDVIRHKRLRRNVRGGGAMHWHFKQPNLAFLRPGPAYIASERVVDGVVHRSGPSDHDSVTIIPPNVEVEGAFEMPDAADAIAEHTMVFVSNAFLQRCVGLHIDRPLLSQQTRTLAHLLIQLESEVAHRDDLFDLYAEGWVRLAGLAEVAQRSKHHLLRAFRQTAGETPHQHVLVMLGILLFLGCFMDQVSMILLPLPFYIPLAMSHHIDMTWLILVAMALSLLTPPFGLLLFVMKGVAPRDIPLSSVYAAAAPFVLLKLLVLTILLVWPQIATWLPDLILK